MTAVTFPNGNGYSDAGETANDMRNGGFRTNMLPMIGDTIAVANNAVTAAAAAVPAATTATTAATTATQQAAIAVAAANTAVGTSLIKQPSEIAGIDPVLDFVFSASTAVPSGVITGSSSKWVTGPNGLLTSVAAGTCPIDYDPTTGVTRGLLVEESRTNLLTNSVSLSGWSTSSATRTLNAATGIDGAQSASRFVATATSNTSPNVTLNTTSGTTYVMSLYCKLEVGSTWMRVRLADGSTTVLNAWFNISTRAVGTVNAATGTITSFSAAQPINVGNGWVRIGVTFSTTASTLAFACAAATGDGVGAMAIGDQWLMGWAQHEAGSFPTSYIPTVGSTVTRAADVNTLLLSSVPGWNASEGMIYVEAELSYGVTPISQTLLSLDDGTANNIITLFSELNSGKLLFRTANGGVTSTDILLSTLAAAPTSTFKAAIAWSSGVARASFNGSSLSVTGTVVPAVTKLSIFNRGDGLRPATGRIRRLTLFPRALSSSTLPLLTA
ncbi:MULTISPECIES: hypothetical protein [unclassified Azospirillum]|uniref:phage head spike fiber domain-containing protein n=1 Tax=unclassified Azospirillum TaxID=2630922 RepID=UPI0011B1D512|nr:MULTISPECIES: hypothetical protein [unclassified Azospirillum]